MRFFLTALWLALAGWLSGADALSEQIHSAQAAGNYSQAAKLYRQLIATGTDTPEVRSNCGVMLYLSGQPQAALEQLQMALRRESSLAAANLFAGLSEFDLGRPKAALPYLETARKLDPARPAPLLGLGKVYVALRDYRRANEVYGQAVSLDSQLAEAWYGLGVTDRSLAEEKLNAAARAGSARNAETKQQVQQLLDGALQALNKAVELDPNSARTHLLMAESLADSGKLVEAVPEYQTAIKLDPALDAAYLGLASEYWKDRQFDRALPLLKHVLSHSPRDAEANGMMADILEHDGHNDAAQQHAETALAANPDLIQTRVVLARVYLVKQQPKLAIAELRKVAGADPDGSYHFLLYRAYRAIGDQRDAGAAMAEFQRLRYSAQKP